MRHVLTGAGTSPCLREYFSLGGCAGLSSYNIFCYCPVYLACDNSIDISKSGSSALMVHLGGCDLVLLTGMVLTLLTGSPVNLVYFFALMALFSGYSVSTI